jgi:hypothetical protein
MSTTGVTKTKTECCINAASPSAPFITGTANVTA